jgi:hypothetical protein
MEHQYTILLKKPQFAWAVEQKSEKRRPVRSAVLWGTNSTDYKLSWDTRLCNGGKLIAVSEQPIFIFKAEELWQ